MSPVQSNQCFSDKALQAPMATDVHNNIHTQFWGVSPWQTKWSHEPNQSKYVHC